MSLLNMLKDQLAGDATAKLGQQVGMRNAETEKAIHSALPTIMAALAGNAVKSGGDSALAGALDRDHDGSVLDDLAGFLNRGDDREGEGILKHVLGGQRGAVEAEVAKDTGLSSSAISALLPKLAPLVMGALGREKKTNGLDVAGLVGLLSQEGKEARSSVPPGLSMLGSILDRDGDGLGADDLADAGKDILGKLF